MRILVLILTFVFYSTANAQFNRELFHDLLSNNTVTPPPTLKAFTDATIPVGDLDLLTPQRGANTFYTTTQYANIPNPATSTWSLDNYARYYWVSMNPTNGNYDFSGFDNDVNTSISRRQRFQFRVQTVAQGAFGVPTVGGAQVVYPIFVHTAMQAEANPDWIPPGTGMWAPNWNSNSYLNAWQTFCIALNAHIMSSSFNGVQYRNVISKIDIAGYGNWNEWHTFPWITCGCIPAGVTATAATLQRIIDISLTSYPSFPAMGNINMFVGEVPASVGYYALTASNSWGRIGINNDHFAWTSTYTNDVPNNVRTFNGVVFGTAIQQQYQFAPIAGEPMNDAAAVTTGGPCAFWHFETEVRAYHASQWNNQNGTGVTTACVNANYLAASKACGYRDQVTGGTVSNNFAAGSNMQVNLNWQNAGIAPNYENWQVRIDLRNAAGTVVWFGLSGFSIKFFQPGTITFSDNFSTIGVPAGAYTLNVMVLDPTAYRGPLPLYNTGVRADGSYLLTTINIV